MKNTENMQDLDNLSRENYKKGSNGNTRNQTE